MILICDSHSCQYDLRRKLIGGVKFNSTCQLTQLGDNPQDTVTRILGSYRIHNAEVLIREDVTVDDLIDVVEGNRKMMWRYLGLIRIYTKRRGQAPDLSEPIVLSAERDGLTVEAACKAISKELIEIFNFALVWGRSTKYNPQRVGLTHMLCDEDVLQVDAYNAKILKERKRLRNIKR
ncbi:unnamed protein product [Sphagnum jensenii]|uniref:TGS domain-containing protein n=1 Tax=Sphagnum jensenii TaxID=128206 RepID=A0ABP0VH24_9BRYO